MVSHHLFVGEINRLYLCSRPSSLNPGFYTNTDNQGHHFICVRVCVHTCTLVHKCEVVACVLLKCEWAAIVALCLSEWPACDGCLLSAVDTSPALCVWCCSYMNMAHLPVCKSVGFCVCVHLCPVGMAAVWWQALCTLQCLLRWPLRCSFTPANTKKEEKGEHTRTDTHQPVACHWAAMLWNRHRLCIPAVADTFTCLSNTLEKGKKTKIALLIKHI